MTKKILMVLVIGFIEVSGAFAQIAINGDVSTNFSSVTPSIGIKYGLEKLDILGGISAGGYSTWVKYDTSEDRTTAERQNNATGGIGINIFAGVAPKAVLNERWQISIPLLATVGFGWSGKTTYDDTDTQNSRGQPNDSSVGILFRAGGRAEYALSRHRGIYTGFLWSIVSWSQTKDYAHRDGFSSYEEWLVSTTNTWNWFNSGVVQLGVTYKF